jgi:large subunit ribosomal protein L1
MKHSRRYRAMATGHEPTLPYSVDQAVGIVKKNANAKFDETIEVAARLGVGRPASRHGTDRARARPRPG